MHGGPCGYTTTTCMFALMASTRTSSIIRQRIARGNGQSVSRRLQAFRAETTEPSGGGMFRQQIYLRNSRIAERTFAFRDGPVELLSYSGRTGARGHGRVDRRLPFVPLVPSERTSHRLSARVGRDRAPEAPTFPLRRNIFALLGA